jgi:hypothetical protein
VRTRRRRHRHTISAHADADINVMNQYGIPTDRTTNAPPPVSR